MQFDHVKTGEGGHLRGGDELRRNRIHIGAVHRLWHLIARPPGQGRGGHHRPVALVQRRVPLFPAQLGRPLAPRMADLAAQLRPGLSMGEIDDTRPGRLMLGCIQTGTAGGNAPFRRDAGHLGIDQPSPALGTFGVMHEMPVGRAAIHSAVLRHGRDDDAVLQRHVAQTKGREHRRTALLPARVFLEPVFGLPQPGRIAQAQVFVADALAAGQQGIGELGGRHIEVAFDLFEPFQRIARGRLQAQHLDPAFGLIALKSGFHRGFGLQVIGQGDGGIKRKAGPGADRKMPRRRRIPHQHDVLMIPGFADHPGEVHPDGRPTQMRRVGHQGMTPKVGREDAFAGGDRFFLFHMLEAPAIPGLLRAFHNEGRGGVIELIGMGPDPAMFGLLEDEGEGIVEFLMRAQPDELAQAHVDIGLEHAGIFAAHGRIDPVAGDDQIVVVAILFRRLEFRLEPQIDAQFPRPALQQHQNAFAPDPGKAMPARHRPHAVMDHRDIVPIGEIRLDRRRADRIIARHVGQRIIRQHHPPAEGVIRLVPLQHGDLMRRVAQLHRDREIQPGGATPKAQNLHVAILPMRQSGKRCHQVEIISSLKFLA